MAPEISSGLWINSEPLTLKSLHGRVVLIEFWTFACYNCRNTLPSLKKWDVQYREQRANNYRRAHSRVRL